MSSSVDIVYQVQWRMYPCSCIPCMTQTWEDCKAKTVVGELETVVQAGESMY